ncbi:hypothetical protein GIB67_039970 [Kingdonia uniflora]|uniref:Uncharacterized protein n=1 Tax=Kingdonia uniflora TaxID=39325 RepID=A0A7J7P3J1_9MAGN|nr:hypothetical protein GIB67_039970 [Kingdonia uniflora]
MRTTSKASLRKERLMSASRSFLLQVLEVTRTELLSFDLFDGIIILFVVNLTICFIEENNTASAAAANSGTFAAPKMALGNAYPLEINEDLHSRQLVAYGRYAASFLCPISSSQGCADLELKSK